MGIVKRHRLGVQPHGEPRLMNTGSLAARLQRIRAENRAGRVVDGLGAANVSYARQYGNLGLGAVIAPDSTGLDGALAHLARYDAQKSARDAKQEAEIAKLKASNERLSASVKAMQASWAAGSGYEPGNPLRRQSLAGRLKAKGFGIERNGQIELGPIQIGGPGLIGLSPKFLRGSGGKIFGAAIISRVAASGLQAVASSGEGIRNVLDKGGSGGEVAKTAGLTLARGARDTFSAVFGLDDAAAAVASLITGKPQADQKQALEKFYDKLFTTQEELARRKKAKDAALLDAFQQVNETVAKQWVKINTALPESFRLAGREDLRRYRAEMNAVNADLLRAKEQRAKDHAARIAEGS